MKDNYIYVDQARYATSIFAKYLDTDTVKKSTNVYKNNSPFGMIFYKSDTSNSDKQVNKLTREFNIHYRSCIGNFIYF